jgi:hypothetical protein
MVSCLSYDSDTDQNVQPVPESSAAEGSALLPGLPCRVHAGVAQKEPRKADAGATDQGECPQSGEQGREGLPPIPRAVRDVRRSEHREASSRLQQAALGHLAVSPVPRRSAHEREIIINRWRTLTMPENIDFESLVL